LEDLSKERLAQIILDQQQTIRELRGEIQKLKEANEHLREQLETSEREGKRQAAPFRRKEQKRSENPSEPGRKEGHEGQTRAVPTKIDRRVEAELEACPHCEGTDIGQQRPIKQYIEELPPRQVETVELVTYRGECSQCGAVESSHPLKTSGATGAAGRQVGPRAQAVATSLVYDQGLTLRKACEVIEELFGLRLSPGGLSQIAARAGQQLEPEEAKLAEAARSSSVQHVDETSWWVASADPERQPHWLWVFAGPSGQTIYRVDHRRNREVVDETLGSGFSGVLVSDCLNIYDSWAGGEQQKCYAHHLKAVSTAQSEHEALCGGEPSAYLRRVRALLQGAMGLGAAQEEIPAGRADDYRKGLEESADRLLSPRARSDLTDEGLTDPEDYVRNRLWKQRDHLFTFLDHAGVAATNNLAERRLRPAVIQRKLSCGNQTEKGARTWEILASLAATYAQRGRSFVKLVKEAVSFEPQLAVVR